MVAEETRTLSVTDDPEGPESRERRPHLFLVLECRSPAAPPARLSLAAIDAIAIGRGAARALDRSGKRLDLRVADPWMSSAHARVSRLVRRWVVEDLGSKNGTRVNGERVDRAELADGDLVEIGHTFFLFRESVPSDPSDPTVLDASTASFPSPALATLSPSLARSFARLAAVARSDIAVLIEGETGTGKEVVARAIHAISGRPGDLVAVNCGALPAGLVEGELFGHKKGAFSGALDDRPGLVRAADRGTLFLDEIGDLPPAAQAALLRVLQEREVRPIGATRPIPVDLRVVAATHRPLDQLAASGAFRADLLARLAGHRVVLPPLRERREDLGLIAAALLARAAKGAAITIAPRAARALLAHPFPGNVRELEKALAAAVVLAAGAAIDLEHLPEALQRAPASASGARDGEDATRREALIALLREHDGNITAVARAMGKARMQVQRWLKRYEIDPAAYRKT